jgi:threonine dehydrogenase-like Zn-dependent dehydrogenase
MTIRGSDKEVLVVVGTGGMGLSTARRVGAGRVIMLADINQIGALLTLPWAGC